MPKKFKFQTEPLNLSQRFDGAASIECEGASMQPDGVEVKITEDTESGRLTLTLADGNPLASKGAFTLELKAEDLRKLARMTAEAVEHLKDVQALRVGKALRDIRAARKITQAAFAESIGTTGAHYSRIEYGHAPFSAVEYRLLTAHYDLTEEEHDALGQALLHCPTTPWAHSLH